MTVSEAKRYRNSEDPAVRAAAERVLEAKRARASRVKAKPRAAGKTRAERKAERKERAAEIRAAVFDRAAGLCEWCLRPYMTCEWHHLRGAGERQFMESIENTAAVCWDCHRGWERQNLDTLARAKAWAIRFGYRDAIARVARRTDKALEARNAPAVRLEVA